MRSVLWMLLLLSPVANADVYLDIAAGYNLMSKDKTLLGPKDIARFTITWMPKEQGFYTSFTHVSHWSAGKPFNNKLEDEMNVFEVGYKTNLSNLLKRN